MSTRLDEKMRSCAAGKRTALIPFITAGDPVPDATVEIMHGLVAGGADVIELGVPFSDPMADGPVIQQSSERALAKGVSLKHVLGWVEKFRLKNAATPVVLMGYANPIEAMGTQRFTDECKRVGVDGVLVVDYPPEEAQEWSAQLGAADIAPIFLLSPTTPAARIAQVGKLARGYVYYVSLRGVTGAGNLDTVEVGQKLSAIRAHVKVPVGVGFGIRDGATARAVAAHADAVVIGSALVTHLHAAGSGHGAAAQAWLGTIRSALDA
jgi:tryptophan synthase alpha chain